MEASKKIVSYVKNSLSTIGSMLAPCSPDTEVHPTDNSLEWSNNNDTIIIKRAELESMQAEMFECSETIKKLKRRDTENQSQIQDYETMFTKFLKKNIDRNDTLEELIPTIREKYENEITKLRSSEDRLRSHVQALKRDLVAAEQKSENIEDNLEQRLIFLKKENDTLKDELNRVDYENKQLNSTNKELKMILESKCEELTEVIAYCHYLLK